MIKKIQAARNGGQPDGLFFSLLHYLLLNSSNRYRSVFSVLINSDLVYIPLVNDKMYLAINQKHPYNLLAKKDGNRHEAKLADFRDEGFILLDSHQQTRLVTNRIFDSCGITPHISFETQHTDTVNALVSAGMGIGLVPQTTCYLFKKISNCSYYKLTDVDTTRTVYAIYNKQLHLSKAASEFIEIFKRTATFQIKEFDKKFEE